MQPEGLQLGYVRKVLRWAGTLGSIDPDLAAPSSALQRDLQCSLSKLNTRHLHLKSVDSRDLCYLSCLYSIQLAISARLTFDIYRSEVLLFAIVSR